MNTTPVPPDRAAGPSQDGAAQRLQDGFRPAPMAAVDALGGGSPWLERSVALLERSAETLDAATRSRLNRARHAALSTRRGRRREWMLGGSLATAVLALVLALGLQHRKAPLPAGDTPVPSAGDTALLVADDNLDLYENLDFYTWLDAQQRQGHE